MKTISAYGAEYPATIKRKRTMRRLSLKYWRIKTRHGGMSRGKVQAPTSWGMRFPKPVQSWRIAQEIEAERRLKLAPRLKVEINKGPYFTNIYIQPVELGIGPITAKLIANGFTENGGGLFASFHSSLTAWLASNFDVEWEHTDTSGKGVE